MSQSPFSAAQQMQVEARKERLCRHEFGHYVVARALGFPTGEIRISLHVEGRPANVQVNGGVTVTLSQGILSLVDLQRYLERRIIILYAGACAETLKSNLTVDLDEASNILGTENDFAKAAELIHILRNVRHATTGCGDAKEIDREINELNDTLWRKAAQLVEQNTKTIILLVEKVKNRGQKFVVSADVLNAWPEMQTIASVAKSDDLLA